MLLLTLAAAGCGGGSKGIPTNYVEGFVTLDGSPVEGAHVTFIPSAADGKTAGGYADVTGKYTLTSDDGEPQKGALEGEYKVTVVKMAKTTEPRPQSSRNTVNPSSATRPPVNKPTQTYITPKVYSDVKQTPLTATVKKGKNDIPLTLTSTGQ